MFESFPFCTTKRRRLSQKAFDGAVARGGSVILLVEDDPYARDLMLLVLARGGYTVFGAANGEEAVALSRDYPGRIDALLTDILMPGMDGHELCEIIMGERPGIRILQLSGYPGETITCGNRELPFLQKPFTSSVLMAKVGDVLNGPPGEPAGRPLKFPAESADQPPEVVTSAPRWCVRPGSPSQGYTLTLAEQWPLLAIGALIVISAAIGLLPEKSRAPVSTPSSPGSASPGASA